jgi:hypothetical protein
VAHILIEMRVRKPNALWEVLWRRHASSDAELAEVRAAIEGKDLLEAIETLPAGIVRDTLDIVLREEGHPARVSVIED